MNTCAFQYLVNKNHSFKELKEKKLYIDKTDLIESLASYNIRPLLFLRPPKFGKTLLIDTLKVLFSEGIEFFYDLKIGERWQDRVYPVIHIDFANFKSKCFDKNAILSFHKAFTDAGIHLDIDNGVNSSEFIYKAFDAISDTCVLLVDNCDYLIYDAVNSTRRLKARKLFMHSFYQAIAKNRYKFRFIFITGTLRLGVEELQNAFEDLLDLSFDSKYQSLLGFTEDELIHYLKKEITKTAFDLNKHFYRNRHDYDFEKILDLMRDCFSGYRFSQEQSAIIYNPRDIINFLAKKDFNLEPCSYITDNENCKNLNLKFQEVTKDKLRYFWDLDVQKHLSFADLKHIYIEKELNIESVFFQFGFMSIQGFDGEKAILGLTNLSIKRIFADLVMNQLYFKGIFKGNYCFDVTNALFTSFYSKKFNCRDTMDIVNSSITLIPPSIFENFNEKSLLSYIKTLITHLIATNIEVKQVENGLYKLFFDLFEYSYECDIYFKASTKPINDSTDLYIDEDCLNRHLAITITKSHNLNSYQIINIEPI